MVGVSTTMIFTAVGLIGNHKEYMNLFELINASRSLAKGRYKASIFRSWVEQGDVIILAAGNQ